MTTDPETLRKAAFKADLSMWLSLSHFLSADLVRELAAAAIDELSAGTLGLADLCDADVVTEGTSFLRSWLVRLRPGIRGIGGFAQDLIQALCWQSDPDLYVPSEGLSDDERAKAEEVVWALDLGAVDLRGHDAWQRWRGELPRSLKPLGGAIAALARMDSSPEQERAEALASLEGAPQPLWAVAVKHLGDLCFDIDDAAQALEFYRLAERLCQEARTPEWRELTDALRDIATQSASGAVHLTQSAGAAANILSALNQPNSIEERPLLAANAALDSMYVQNRMSEEFHILEDIRPAILNAPQLHTSHHLDSALEYGIERKFRDAHRRFWSALRRRTALGSAVLTRQAMAFYGRSLLEELQAEHGSFRRPDQFALALQMLVASGRKDAVADEAARRDLIEAYLTKEVVEFVADVAARYPGMRAERQLVALGLFEAWLKEIDPQAEAIARDLLVRIAVAAKDAPWSMSSDRDVGRAALKALRATARARPDLRGLASAEVAAAFVSRLEAGHFHPASSALEMLAEYTDALDEDDLVRCVEACLKLLETAEPEKLSWALMIHAVDIVSSRPARALWPEREELGKRSAASILRYGLEAIAEAPRLLALLDQVEPYLERSSADDNRFAEIIRQLREGALHTNRSDVVRDIGAIISAPRLAGKEGIADALTGFETILQRAASRKLPSTNVGYAYEVLLQLAQTYESLVTELELNEAEEKELAERVLIAVERFWKGAPANLQMFVPFAIPPGDAISDTIVHNWAFASLAFAQKADAAKRMDAALDAASVVPALEQPIAVARAVRFRSDERELLDLAEIGAEAREPFYAALGSRLAILAANPDVLRKNIVQALLGQCLRHGPNGLDAAVLMQAIELELRPEDPAALTAYALRLKGDRDLRRGLQALINRLEEQGRPE